MTEWNKNHLQNVDCWKGLVTRFTPNNYQIPLTYSTNVTDFDYEGEISSSRSSITVLLERPCPKHTSTKTLQTSLSAFESNVQVQIHGFLPQQTQFH